MNIVEEKARLKQEIDKVNDPEILYRISELLSYKSGSLMTDEQLAIVREEREKYTTDPSGLISFEDFKANIRKKHGF